MSSNNHAIIRYRTIDRCLKSTVKNYFLKDLIQECSDAVHEYEELKTGKAKEYRLISRRAIMYDLKFMKDENFGFGAPIEHDLIDGYYYSDPNFEAFKAKISKSDTQKLSEALSILKQLSGEAQFKDLESMVIRLEETYQIKRNRNEKSIVQFENSTNIEGQRWVTMLKKEIGTKSSLLIDYMPFGSDNYLRVISPYLLKEYNSRWFLIGYDHDNKSITNLGLDRIQTIKTSLVEFYTDPNFDYSAYSKDIVGVSIPPNTSKIRLKLKAHGKQKYYLNTKPIHESQKLIKEEKGYAIFQLDLIPNFELQSKILSNIDTLKVLSPKSFREAIENRLKKAFVIYKD